MNPNYIPPPAYNPALYPQQQPPPAYPMVQQQPYPNAGTPQYPLAGSVVSCFERVHTNE